MEQINQTPLRVLIIAKYDPTIDWVQLSLQEQQYEIVGRLDSIDQAWKQMNRTQVDIVVADTSGDGVLDIGWIQKLTVQFPETLTLVIAMNSDMNFIREAMLVGAHGFLLKPFDLAELARSIEQMHQLWLQRHTLLSEARDGKATTRSTKAHSIAVFSPKGGTGVTTLAVNLAVVLKQLTDTPVLLVDTDLRTADVDIFLNVFSENTILDLIEVNQEVDEELLERVSTEHASGITVLRGNPDLQFIESPIEPGQMITLVEELKAIWNGYIIFNTSNALDRANIEVLDAVDTVLLTTTPQLSALRVTRNFLELAEIYQDPGEKWQVIMTSYQSQKALRMNDIEESIRYPIKATIAQDVTLATTSINRGMPLILSDSKSVVARDILSLGKQLMKEATPWPQKTETSGTKQAVVSEEEDGQSKKSKRFWQFVTSPLRTATSQSNP